MNTRQLIVDRLLEIARRVEQKESIEEFRATIDLCDGGGEIDFIDFSDIVGQEKGTSCIFDLIQDEVL